MTQAYRSAVSNWVYNYPPERFYHIAYAVSDANLPAALETARKRNAGYVFFTDLGLPNPYGKLPLYMSREVASLVPPQ